MQFAKFNPFNSLFGRVFIWFWCALLIILLSAFFLTKQLSNVVEVNAVDDKQALQASETVQRLKRNVERSNDLNQSLRRLGQRSRQQIVASNTQKGPLRFSFPGHLAGNVGELTTFDESDSLLLIRLNNMEFVGPFDLDYKKNTYKIYVGRLLLRSERTAMSRSSTAIAGLILAIFLSTVFCFVLVLSITKPLGALRSASKRLATGDLNTRIEGLESRKDEVGSLAQDFNAMASRLQNLINSQKQLMANISHELRTPLTRLQLAVALLEAELAKQVGDTSIEQSNPHLDRIEGEIVKMDQMIGQVLTLAKLNTSEQGIDLQPTALNALIENVLTDAQFEADAMHKSLSVSDIPQVTIQADARLLASAIENILRNAIRFADTKLLLDMSFFTQNDLAQHQYHGVEIRISDDGVGMSKAELSTVFEPFVRGSHQVHEVSKGAGLGLSIAKAAVEMHGGTISATSHSFTAQKQSNNKPSERSVEEASPLSGLSVIIRLPIIDKVT